MTILELVSRFRWRIGATAALVLIEAAIDLLFPLFIGIAINGLLDGDRTGVIALGGLGLVALTVGSARRFFDTRAYSGIFETIGAEMVARERLRKTETSAIAARTTLLGEFVDFLEDSMPALVTTLIGTVGALIIIAGLNTNVFLACLALLSLTLATYWANGRRNYRLHAGYNDELEQQVSAIAADDQAAVTRHFKTLMRWNRKLSDLETVSYVVIWLGVIALLVYAPLEVIQPGETDYGYAFSAILYVFQYIEALIALPLFIQQAIRLREISARLADRPADPDVADHRLEVAAKPGEAAVRDRRPATSAAPVDPVS